MFPHCQTNTMNQLWNVCVFVKSNDELIIKYFSFVKFKIQTYHARIAFPCTKAIVWCCILSILINSCTYNALYVY